MYSYVYYVLLCVLCTPICTMCIMYSYMYYVYYVLLYVLCVLCTPICTMCTMYSYMYYVYYVLLYVLCVLCVLCTPICTMCIMYSYVYYVYYVLLCVLCVMDIETFRNYCLAKKGVTESFPFDDVTLVFKVINKMFALTGLDEADFKVNLKCTPEYAETLRRIIQSRKTIISRLVIKWFRSAWAVLGQNRLI